MSADVNELGSMALLKVNRTLSIVLPAVPEKTALVTLAPETNRFAVAVYLSVVSPLVVSPSWFIALPDVSRMFGPITIVYVPGLGCAVNATSNWVLPLPLTAVIV